MDFHGHSVRKNVFTYGPGFYLGENNYYRSRIFIASIKQLTDEGKGERLERIEKR